MTGSSFSGLHRSCYSGARGRPADEAVTRKPRTSGLTKPDLMGAESVRSRERPGLTRRGRAGRGSSVLILGLILLVIGFIASMAILETIGIISRVIAVVLWIWDRWDARLAALVARQRATRTGLGRLVAVVSARDGHLEGLGLGRAAEGVVGLHDAVKGEPVAHELLRRELALSDQFEQHRRRRGAHQAGGDRDVLDPQVLQLQLHRLAVHAHVRDRPAGADEFGG